MVSACMIAVLAAMAVASQGTSLKLPPYMKQCSRSDPKLNECVLKSARSAISTLVKGDEHLHMPVLDPLHLDQVKLDESSGGVKFRLTLNNAQMFGLSKVQVNDMSFDLEKKVIETKLEVKGTDMKLISKYNIDGKILVLPIKGDGDMNLTAEDVNADIKMEYNLVKHANGLEYAKVKDSNIDINVTRAYFKFENLFNGDKILGDNMNVFLNENWKDVFDEVKPAMSEVLRAIAVQIFSKVTDKVAYNYIFLP